MQASARKKNREADFVAWQDLGYLGLGFELLQGDWFSFSLEATSTVVPGVPGTSLW